MGCYKLIILHGLIEWYCHNHFWPLPSSHSQTISAQSNNFHVVLARQPLTRTTQYRSHILYIVILIVGLNQISLSMSGANHVYNAFTPRHNALPIRKFSPPSMHCKYNSASVQPAWHWRAVARFSSLMAFFQALFRHRPHIYHVV